MIKYCFSNQNGDVYFELPESVSFSTLFEIMKDCGYKSCYMFVKDPDIYRLKIICYE